MRTIYRTAGCVVILYDEATKRPVCRDEFLVVSESGEPAIYKAGGMYVFIGDTQPREMIISAKGYQTRQIRMKKDTFYYHIWMMPSRSGVGSGQMTAFLGYADPGREVLMSPEKTEIPYRILEDIHSGEREIAVYHISFEKIEGREFLIGTDEPELIRIQQKTGKNRYLLDEPVQKDYTAAETGLWRVNRVMADKTGSFFAVFPDIPPEGSRCLIQTGNDRYSVRLNYREMVTERSSAGEK